MRKLLNNTEVEEFSEPVELVVSTKSPGKWKLIDMETGQEYVGSKEGIGYGKWIRLGD